MDLIGKLASMDGDLECIDAPCALASCAGGRSSCADELGALAVSNALELSDIAGRCATGESGKGGVTSLLGGCVLAAGGNGDESSRTVFRALATGAKSGLS